LFRFVQYLIEKTQKSFSIIIRSQFENSKPDNVKKLPSFHHHFSLSLSRAHATKQIPFGNFALSSSQQLSIANDDEDSINPPSQLRDGGSITFHPVVATSMEE